MAEQKYFFRLLLVCEPISTGFCRFPIPELFRAKVAVVLLAFCDDFAEGRAVLLLGAVRSFRGPLAVILRSFCGRFAPVLRSDFQSKFESMRPILGDFGGPNNDFAFPSYFALKLRSICWRFAVKLRLSCWETCGRFGG